MGKTQIIIFFVSISINKFPAFLFWYEMDQLVFLDLVIFIVFNSVFCRTKNIGANWTFSVIIFVVQNHSFLARLINQVFFCYENFNFQWNPILLQADLFKELWLGPINFGIVSHFYLGSCNLHWYKLCFMSTIKICARKLLVCQFLLYKVIAYRRGL